MLRILMNLLKPSDTKLMKSPATVTARMRLAVYRFLLKCLMRTYSYYSISDTIIIGNNQGTVTHEFRDSDFENELTRYGMDIRMHLRSAKLPLSRRKNGHVFLFKYFRFRDVMTVRMQDKCLYISHRGDSVIDGSRELSIKVSSDADLIKGSRIMFPIEDESTEPYSGTKQARAKSPVSSGLSESRKGKMPAAGGGNLFSHDPLPKHTDNAAENAADTGSPLLGKRGFNIDTTF